MVSERGVGLDQFWVAAGVHPVLDEDSGHRLRQWAGCGARRGRSSSRRGCRRHGRRRPLRRGTASTTMLGEPVQKSRRQLRHFPAYCHAFRPLETFPGRAVNTLFAQPEIIPTERMHRYVT